MGAVELPKPPQEVGIKTVGHLSNLSANVVILRTEFHVKARDIQRRDHSEESHVLLNGNQRLRGARRCGKCDCTDQQQKTH